MAEHLGVALLGVTHPHASGRVRALIADPTVEIVAGADDAPTAAAFFDHFGIPQVDAESILGDDRVDAVLIHSASSSMAALASSAMRAGKAAFVEKPAGRTLEDLQGLAAAAADTGLPCQVGFNFRASPAIAEAQRLLDQRVLGDLVIARLHGGCSFDEAATNHVNAPGEMGGAFWVIATHLVDLALMHFGLPEAVNARLPKFDGFRDPHFREDAASVTLSYPQRLVSLDFTSWDALPWAESWEVSLYGTNGELHVTPLPARVRLALKEAIAGHRAGWSEWMPTAFPVEWAGKTTHYSPEIPEVVNTELFGIEVAAFLGSVRKAPVPGVRMCSAADALAVAEVASACYRSSRLDGGQVRLDGGAR